MAGEQRVPNVWVVRADGGAETLNCVNGGFTGIGWFEIGDLSDAADRAAIAERYAKIASNREGPSARGQAVGMLTRFMHDIQVGDWVITPETDDRRLRYGEVTGEYRYETGPRDDCRYLHRRDVKWNKDWLDRWALPGRAQDSLRSALTVFEPSRRTDLLIAMGKGEMVPATPSQSSCDVDPVEDVLECLRELKPHDFEQLIEHLLAAMGFEDTRTTKPTNDGGFDVYGVLSASNVARVEIYGQVKRQGYGRKVGRKSVMDLRGRIPNGAQGVFVTTSDYAKTVQAVADEIGHPRIGLINGEQLVELLVQHWWAIPEGFRTQLALKPGLVPA